MAQNTSISLGEHFDGFMADRRPRNTAAFFLRPVNRTFSHKLTSREEPRR